MQKSLALLVFSVLLHSGAAQATAMQEPPRTGMSLSFDNGDSLEVACRRYGEFCKLKLRVNGKRFLFESKDLGDREIIPERASLYSGEASGREKYFSFEISVVCPEVNGKMPLYDCVASVLVRENAAPEVSLIRRATRHVENP